MRRDSLYVCGGESSQVGVVVGSALPEARGRRMTRRDWKLARMAHMSRPCRICGLGAYGLTPFPATELAHLLGRRFDRIKQGPRGGKVAEVDPQSVVVLCRPHHTAYDSGLVDLWDRLTPEERVWCIDRVGEGEARRRVSGRDWQEAA